ncbi:iron uptake transporter deferrochelatase/peroxidase subunit [Cytobacillus sp. Hz8]|uniref:iron uptake transporter deferrochelatase/peroxidase subunit n=1 Tax=Cytobacillus sp. Hz8 TaxID=3347168 RepID=UPI0035DE27A8
MTYKTYSRRDMLKMAGVGGVGVILGASGMGGILSAAENHTSKIKNTGIVPFYGKYQSGIITPAQDHINCVAMDITTKQRSELVQLFQDWTKASAFMTKGKPVGELSTNGLLPPKDTGEAAGLIPSNLTITFGVGPSLFMKEGKDRFGLKGKQPKELVDLPKFPLDALKEEWTGGDLCIQACADDAQIAFHAVRNLVRIARGKAIIRWTQTGFQRSKQADPQNSTPRNLFGFKDGTINPNLNNQKELDQHIWIQQGDGPDWLVNGSYMVIRRIQMHIEVWDRSTLQDQEATFGRYRDSGASLGQDKEFDPVDLQKKDKQGNHYIPETAHVRLAHGNGKEMILRRGYSYADGLDLTTGSFDAGLLFIAFQRSPSKQFIPIQERLAKNDKLNEYTVHRGSAIFACLPGAKSNGYIGEALFA